MKKANRKFDFGKKWRATWLLLAVLVYVAHPLGTVLFCDDDSDQHSTHISENKGHHESTAEAGHDHADLSTQVQSASLTQLSLSSAPDGHSDESCCCGPDDTGATLVAATTLPIPSFIHHVLVSPAVTLPQLFVLETPTVFSRAGPAAPTILSQLRRSSLLHRAPPISA